MWITGLIVCIGWILSLCFHEFSHALIAYWGGDTSVKDKGYLTFNPLKYTQPGLSLIMPLVFILIGGIGLPGGAVYINNGLLRSRWWSSLVSAAGPVSNIISTFLLVIPFWLFNFPAENQVIILNNYDPDILINIVFPSLAYLIYIEIFAVIFNLLPIPPFDGYGIIEPWLSDNINDIFSKYSKYSYYFIFGLFIFIPQVGWFFSDIIQYFCDLLGIPDLVIFQGRELFDQPVNKLMAIIIIVMIAYFLKLNENTWYQKGNTLARKEQDEEALAAYNKAIEIKPNYLDAWLEKGNSLFRLEKYQEAAESYQEVIKLDANNYQAWLNLGHVSFNQGKYEPAVIAYQKTISLKSEDNYHQNLINLAQALFCLNRQEEAVAILQERIKTNPEDSDLWIIQASYLYSLKRYQEIIDLCQDAIAIHNQNVNLLYYLGIALQHLQKYPAAKEVFDQIIALDAHNILALSGQAHLDYVQQNYTAAISNYQKITKIEPDNENAWYNMACCYALQKKSPEAISALKQAIKIHPKHAITLAKQDTDFAFLQGNPSFQNIVNN